MNYNLKEEKMNNSDYSLIELILAKHRNGPIGSIKLKFDEKRTKFSNVDF
jgi:replicative DNA helicase